MEKMKRKSRKSKKALVLPLVVVMVIILFVIGLALIRLGLSARMQAVRSVSGISARCAADAGLTKALYLMYAKLSSVDPWDNSTLPEEEDVPLPNSYSSYSFDVNGNEDDGFIIASIGRSGFAEKEVYEKLVVKSLWFGIGIQETLTVNLGANFGTVPPGGTMAVQTNSTASGAIELKNTVVFPGDVIIGPGGIVSEVITTPGGTIEERIEGEAYAADVPLYFPPVIPPNDLDVFPQRIEVKTGNVAGIAPVGAPIGDYVSGQYPGIRLKNGKTLEIYGEVVLYITGDVIIDNGAEIRITAGSSLTLYLDGSMEAKEASAITNENENASSFKICGTETCTSIILKNSADLYSAVYAPSADVILMNSGDLYGAFIGNSVEMKNSSGFFYYEEALGNAGINDDTAYFALERWWED